MTGLGKAINQGRKDVEQYRELLTIVLLKLQGQRTGVRIKKVKVENDSKAIIGAQNLNGKGEQMDISIEDVLVSKSRAMIGAQGKVNLDDFWK